MKSASSGHATMLICGDAPSDNNQGGTGELPRSWRTIDDGVLLLFRSPPPLGRSGLPATGCPPGQRPDHDLTAWQSPATTGDALLGTSSHTPCPKVGRGRCGFPLTRDSAGRRFAGSAPRAPRAAGPRRRGAWRAFPPRGTRQHDSFRPEQRPCVLPWASRYHGVSFPLSASVSAFRFPLPKVHQ